MTTEQIDHNEYPEQLKILSDEQLACVIADCSDAIANYPEGEKAGYYCQQIDADEIAYCSAELRQRKEFWECESRKIRSKYVINLDGIPLATKIRSFETHISKRKDQWPEDCIEDFDTWVQESLVRLLKKAIIQSTVVEKV